jgi:ABC-2 type transport system ATP-binding protein/sodium transport system ATP-binding protein
MITVVDLKKMFVRDGVPLWAVDGLSFQVVPGEVYGLLGPNGAGKTTTLRMILGLIKPDGGFAEVDGFRSSKSSDEIKARIGFVSAGAGLYQWLSVRELLLFFADAYGICEDDAQRELEKLSRVLDLRGFLDQRCSTLSTGQKQRVVLARALIHAPPIMLLDEPTRGLDVVGSQVIFDYIRHLREEGKAVIICTHRLEQAERVCDRFGMMLRGKLVSEGSLVELRERTNRANLVEMFLELLDLTGAAAAATELMEHDGQ